MKLLYLIRHKSRWHHSSVNVSQSLECYCGRDGAIMRTGRQRQRTVTGGARSCCSQSVAGDVGGEVDSRVRTTNRLRHHQQQQQTDSSSSSSNDQPRRSSDAQNQRILATQNTEILAVWTPQSQYARIGLSLNCTALISEL